MYDKSHIDDTVVGTILDNISDCQYKDKITNKIRM
jgi:hypothetical protein